MLAVLGSWSGSEFVSLFEAFKLVSTASSAILAVWSVLIFSISECVLISPSSSVNCISDDSWLDSWRSMFVVDLCYYLFFRISSILFYILRLFLDIFRRFISEFSFNSLFSGLVLLFWSAETDCDFMLLPSLFSQLPLQFRLEFLA